MGIFKKTSPAQDLFSLSNHKIMPGFLQHPNGRFIWFPHTGNAGSDLELFQVSFKSATPAFKEFAEALMSAVSADPGKLEIELDKYPGTSLASTYKIYGAKEIKYPPEKSGKMASFFVFIDSQNVGKLYIPKRNQNGVHDYELGFDLGFDLASDPGFKMWSVTQTDPSIKTGLFMSMEFAIGSSEPDLILLSMVRNPVEYMNYLNRAGLKG
jgi:hypothetical protein